MCSQSRHEAQGQAPRPLRKGLGLTPPANGGEPIAVDALNGERKRAEEALRESEERFSQVAEASREWIWEVDAEGRYTYSSPAVKDILGYDPAEMAGKRYYDFFTPEDREKVLPAARMTFARKQPFFRLVNRNVHKDGHVVVHETTGVPMLDAEGNLLGYRGVDQDITERKRAEAALRESEERFRRLAEASFEGIAIHDKGKILDADQTLATMFGHDLPEVIGMHVLDLTAPESRDLVLRRMASRSEEPFEAVGLRKDGSTFVGEVRGRAIPYQGRVVSVAAIRDITERKRAEAALRESERRYRLLAENATDIIWIRDLDLRVTYVNPAVTRIRGYSVEEVLAQTPEEAMTPASLKLARTVIARELSKERMEKKDLSWWATLELEHTCKDGSTVWLETRAAGLRDEQGRVVAIAGVSRDISERKRAEEALLEARDDLENRVERRMLQGNAYGLTFREMTVLHLVADGKSDKEIASTLGISALTASKHLANILHKMGAASRTEAGVRAVRERLLD